jgi:hypothetical protein
MLSLALESLLRKLVDCAGGTIFAQRDTMTGASPIKSCAVVVAAYRQRQFLPAIIMHDGDSVALQGVAVPGVPAPETLCSAT